MQPEQIEVTLRSRDAWEAVDLGFRMTRRWWLPIFAPWALTLLPVAILLHVLLSDHLWLALLLVWWLKPLFDRIPLHVLGEAFFGHTPSPRETLEAVPRLLRTGVWGSLTVMRLTPMRAVGLPVLQLEHLRGRKRGDRTRDLVGRDAAVALGLHVAGLGFELAVAAGLIQLANLFLPEQMQSSVWAAVSEGNVGLISVFYVAALTLVEPFYVGGGFGFYINRRVYLEGWDIDLAFRRLARRLEARPALVLLALAALCVASPAAALGADPEPLQCPAERPEDARACIDRILATAEFAETTTVEYWYPTWLEDGDADSPAERGAVGPFIRALMELVAGTVRVIAWAALAVVLALILFVALRRLGSTPPQRETPQAADAADERLLRGADLPADLAAATRALWRDGDAVGALSLLYRGAIAHLIDACGVPLPVSATESEASRIARRHAEEGVASDFAELVRAWQLCAYGSQPPTAETFTLMCRTWAARAETGE